MKKVLVFVLIVCMIFVTVACGQKGGSDEGGQGEAAQNYQIAYAELGEGVWAIDYYMYESKFVIEGLGSKFTYTSSDFTPDKMQSDIQSLLTSGVNGLLYYGSFPTITAGVAKMCDDANVPFVMPDQLPLGDYADIVQSSKSFAGAVGSNPYDVGYQMGEYAAKVDGKKKALVLAGGEGDACHDGRTNGFVEGFEKNGGKVLAVSRVASMPDAAVSASDLLTANPDVDAYYGATADHGQFILSAIDAANRSDIMVYCTDADSAIIKHIKDGRVVADGGAVVCTALSTCLLFNALDGNYIKDPDGKSPIFDKCLNFIITAENADTFEEKWITNHPYEVEDYKTLLSRYNPNVDYNTFKEFIDKYSFEDIAK